MADTTIFYSDDFLEHKAPVGHPENEERLISIINKLEKVEYLGLPVVDPRQATHKELELVHPKDYIEIVKEASLNSAHLDPDTYTSTGSYNAALKAAGAVLQAAETINNKELKQAFCLIRPPGHHASKDKAMGFCLFNNVAVGAAWLASTFNKKVAILDFDAHHGNGTQAIFNDRNDVLYCSWHQWPHYPGTGWLADTGHGKGKGFSINFPLPGYSGDSVLINTLDEIVMPVITRFDPHIIMISAGYDSHLDDPLSTLSFTEKGYGAFFAKVQNYCKKNQKGLIACLEGGYNLKSLSNSVLKSLEVLADTNREKFVFENTSDEIISKVFSEIKDFWKL